MHRGGVSTLGGGCCSGDERAPPHSSGPSLRPSCREAECGANRTAHFPRCPCGLRWSADLGPSGALTREYWVSSGRRWARIADLVAGFGGGDSARSATVAATVSPASCRWAPNGPSRPALRA